MRITFPLLILPLLVIAPALCQNQLTEVGVFYGDSAFSYLGKQITAGDFDNDGMEEFVLTSWEWMDLGKNYFFVYDEGWPTDPYMTLQGVNQWDRCGYSTSNLSDINGDGIDDLGIGYRGPYNGIGRLELFYGSTLFDTIPELTISGFTPTNMYAIDLDSCGDVNGDGYNDLITGETYCYTQVCMVMIFWGGPDMDTIPDWTKYEPYLVTRTIALGDINGDGLGDVAVTGWEQPVEIYFGGNPMDTIPDIVLCDWAYKEIGGGVGDVNGDGYGDFCFPMCLPDSIICHDCLYFGGPDVDDIPDVYLLDWWGDDGCSIYGMSSGDFNGDGYSDIASGTGDFYLGTTVNIFLGSPWFNPTPDGWVSGDAIYEFGETIASGDVDGDGDDELLVSEHNYMHLTYGRVHLYTGPDEWIDYGAPVEPGDPSHAPGWYKLDQNYPNPFNSSTTLSFEIPIRNRVNLTIFDIQGQRVGVACPFGGLVTNGNAYGTPTCCYDAGRHEVVFDAGTLPSGIYFARLTAGTFTATRKMVLLK